MKALIEAAEAKIDELDEAIEQACDMSDLENEVHAREEQEHVRTMLWLLQSGKSPAEALREHLGIPVPQPPIVQYTVLSGESYWVTASSEDEALSTWVAWHERAACPRGCDDEGERECTCVTECETLTAVL